MLLKKGALFSAIFSLMLGTNIHAVDISKMSLDEKLGQIMCLSFRCWSNDDKKDNEISLPVTTINDDIESIISKYHIGSVVLFGPNFDNKGQSKKLVSDLQDAAIKSGNPPLIVAVDQEGGIVERFSFDRDQLKNNAQIKTPEEAFEKGNIIAKELKGIGINCNFAPVVDINSNPYNPVINVRSFGDNEGIVSALGKSFLKGLHSENIIGTAKHFPGHGDTSTDSHICLPIVYKDLDDLEKMELKPFKELSNAGVDMVMVAHIAVPNIDKNTVVSKKTGEKIYLPATLSKTIISEILRKKIGFKGVVVTDAMNMKALTDNFGEYEAVKMAINAGADMMCMPVIIQSKNDVCKLENMIKYLKGAIARGEISESRINEAVEKIMELKKKYCNNVNK